jgi:hypothetical protein
MMKAAIATTTSGTVRRTALIPLFAAIWFFAAIGPVRAADYSFFSQVQTRLVNDSNKSRAAAPSDQFRDAFLQSQITLGRRAQVNSNDRMSLALNIRNETCREYTGLNNTGFNLTADWVHKFGIGRSAPAVRIFAGAEHLEFDDPIRDGSEYTAGIMAFKPISNAISITAMYTLDNRTAANDTVYFGNGHTAGGALSIGLPRHATLTFGYAQRKGDATFICAIPTDGLIIPVSLQENAFHLIAYRREAQTTFMRTTLSMPLNPRTTLFAGYERQETGPCTPLCRACAASPAATSDRPWTSANRMNSENWPRP